MTKPNTHLQLVAQLLRVLGVVAPQQALVKRGGAGGQQLGTVREASNLRASDTFTQSMNTVCVRRAGRPARTSCACRHTSYQSTASPCAPRSCAPHPLVSPCWSCMHTHHTQAHTYAIIHPRAPARMMATHTRAHTHTHTHNNNNTHTHTQTLSHTTQLNPPALGCERPRASLC